MLPSLNKLVLIINKSQIIKSSTNTIFFFQTVYYFMINNDSEERGDSSTKHKALDNISQLKPLPGSQTCTPVTVATRPLTNLSMEFSQSQ